MKVKQSKPPLTEVEAIAAAAQARHVERVLAAVVEAGSVSRAAWGLHMAAEDIQAIVDSTQ